MPEAIFPTETRRTRKARQTWLIEARATLEAFDRLTAKGLSERRAATRLGLSLASIHAMRRSGATLDDVFQAWAQRTGDEWKEGK